MWFTLSIIYNCYILVLGRQCNDTSDCDGIMSAECVSVDDDGTSRCMCMSGWRPAGYTDCIPDDYPCGSGLMHVDQQGCVEGKTKYL